MFPYWRRSAPASPRHIGLQYRRDNPRPAPCSGWARAKSKLKLKPGYTFATCQGHGQHQQDNPLETLLNHCFSLVSIFDHSIPTLPDTSRYRSGTRGRSRARQRRNQAHAATFTLSLLPPDPRSFPARPGVLAFSQRRLCSRANWPVQGMAPGCAGCMAWSQPGLDLWSHCAPVDHHSPLPGGLSAWVTSGPGCPRKNSAQQQHLALFDQQKRRMRAFGCMPLALRSARMGRR